MEDEKDEAPVVEGERLWRLSEAAEFITSRPGFGVTKDGFLERIGAAVTAGALTCSDIGNGTRRRGCNLSVFFDEWVRVSDFNKWLESERVPAEYRLPLSFTLPAWPKGIPSDLRQLAPETLIFLSEDIGGCSGSRYLSAGEYIAHLEDIMNRQGEGYFTLNEAAQVLADRRPSVDPIQTVKRLRTAHSKGELRIHKHGSRFPMEVGETIRDFLDLLEVTELDAWLRASVGYGFPKPESFPKSVPAAKASKEQAAGNDDWHELAKAAARGIIKQQAARDLFPSQKNIAEAIAADFRSRTPPIHGTDGKPLSGATIKRHALKGISSATKKARTTGINRGK